MERTSEHQQQDKFEKHEAIKIESRIPEEEKDQVTPAEGAVLPEDDSDRILELRDQLKTEQTEETEEKKPKERTVPTGKSRLVKAFEKLIPMGFRIEVSGQENLREIKDDEDPVIAFSHITDNDAVIAMAGLGKAMEANPRFGQTKLVQMEDNFNNPFFKNVVKATGKENWLSVSVFGDADHRVNKFTPQDFQSINQALEEGYPIAIAESLDPNSDGWNLSSKTGNGAARLALEGNTIIPVTVEINAPMPMKKEFKSQVLALWQLVKRPKTKVHFGEPIRLEPDSAPQIIDTVLTKRAEGKEISREELDEFKKAKDKVNQISKLIKTSIAEMLPTERRGIWKE